MLVAAGVGVSRCRCRADGVPWVISPGYIHLSSSHLWTLVSAKMLVSDKVLVLAKVLTALKMLIVLTVGGWGVGGG